MFFVQLRIALRVLIREKGYTLLHVFGLSLGLATALILGAYVFEDFRFDHFIQGREHIIRMVQTLAFPGTDIQTIENTAGNYATTITDNLPEVEMTCRITGRRGDFLVRQGENVIDESDEFWVDDTFFRMFSYPIVAGDGPTAFDTPSAIVISKKVAEQYFPNGDALGKQIEIVEGELRVVTAVFDIPKPGACIEPRFLMSLASADFDSENSTDHRFATYFRITPGTDLKELERRMNELDIENKTDEFMTIILQKFNDIHLHSADINNQINFHPADGQIVLVSATVAIFVLLIAMINAINLATARATKRAREVGLRKVVGALKSQLVAQYLGEALLSALIAAGLAGLWILLVRTSVGELLQREVPLSPGSLFPWVALLVLAMVTGLLSGLYPAFVLSNTRLLYALRGGSTPGVRRPWLRHSLVTLQFCISVALIISMVVVLVQVRYLKHKNLGYKTDSIVTLFVGDPEMREKIHTIRDEMANDPGVLNAGCSYSIPGRGNWECSGNITGIEDTQIAHFMVMDRAAIDIYGLKVLAGRMLDELTYPSDLFDRQNHSAPMMVNRRYVESIGLTNEEMLEREIQYMNGEWHPVVGVFENFHQRDLRFDYHPMILSTAPGMDRYISLHLSPDNVHATLERLEGIWSEFGEVTFRPRFVSDDFLWRYDWVLRMERLVEVCGLLAILIAALGLIGLVAYSLSRRTKEIGIRRVLGATTAQVLQLMNREYVPLLLIANIVAWPVAGWLMRRWLTEFVYRIELPWWAFPLGGLLTAVLALGLVSLLSVQTVRTNPSDALRTE